MGRDVDYVRRKLLLMFMFVFPFICLDKGNLSSPVSEFGICWSLSGLISSTV